MAPLDAPTPPDALALERAITSGKSLPTPKAAALEKAKWLLVGATLFLPRLLLAILTSACAARRRHCAKGPMRSARVVYGRALTSALLRCAVLVAWIVALVSIAGWPHGSKLRVRALRGGSAGHCG